jgi:DNA-binding transcriptional LysR family regulator
MLDLGSYHAIIACVAAGAGAAIVPAEVLDQAVMASSVQRHPLPSRLRTNRTHLVWPGEASAALRSLMELLPKPRRKTRGAA